MEVAEKIIHFYESLSLDEVQLPQGIRAMNPYFGDNASAIRETIREFFTKYYNDQLERRMILGINPGRLGAGVTGIMFTDTVRLKEKCHIDISGAKSYEPSSEFFYNVIHKFGGVEKFYKNFYVGAVSPLGFVIRNENGKETNYNYYDHRELLKTTIPFIVATLKLQLEFGIKREVCFCLGAGKNYAFLKKLNEKHNFFKTIEPLEHPRFIMQYRRKQMNDYMDTYMKKFNENL